MLLGMVLMLGAVAFAQEKSEAKSTAPQPTAEQRSKMAEVLEKFAGCLRSVRPMTECQNEMMKSYQEMMGTNVQEQGRSNN